MTALGALAVGHVGGGEARTLVDAILPTSRFLCSAVMTASATILALMLTMLGMTVKGSADLDAIFFRRVKQVAFYDMLVLTFATCFLLLHCVPVTKSDELPGWWYPTVYYCLLAVAATLGGALVTIVAMLYAAIRDLIHVFGLDDEDHPLRKSDVQTTDPEGSPTSD